MADLIARIRDLLERQRPDVFCDACIALDLKVSLAEARAEALRLVAMSARFIRKTGACSRCRRSLELTAPS